MTEPKAVNSPGVTLLRVAVLATSLGLGGYLVVQAQQRANPVQESADGPDMPVDIPKSPAALSPKLSPAPDPFPEGDSGPTFLYSSKILQTDSVPPLITDRGYEFPGEAKAEAVFLNTSKSASLPSSGFVFGEEEAGTSKPQTPFLYSSKSVQVVLPLGEQPTTTVEQTGEGTKDADGAKGPAAKSNKDA